MKLARASRPVPIRARTPFVLLACLCAAAFLAGCDDDDDAPPGSQVTPPDNITPTTLVRGADPPGVIIEITSVSGMTGAGGSAQVGDQLAVTFTTKKRDGSRWTLREFTSSGIMVSGPTFNYQRVIPNQSDLVQRSRYNSDGSYTYTFALPIPATYVEPVNNTATFGADDGELTGQALLAGTYTVGMYLGWNYTHEGESFRDGGDATKDFLFGGATELAPREVVKVENCNQCHQSLRAHGGLRRDTRLCILCHTSGAEDRNTNNLTPDVSVDFRVLIHRIHNGAHLPSVVGIGTNPDGSRNYDVQPKKYEVIGNRDSVHDYSEVNFPVWPEGLIAMPRDFGFSALPTTSQAKENLVRTGVTACYVCHGDPDGNGDLTAPLQGDLAHSQPSRRACGSCHDDVDWSHPYTANQSTMPPQGNDSSCLLCHGVTNSALSSEKAHLHPLRDSALNAGLEFEVDAVNEAGTHNSDNTIDPGEKVAVRFRMLNAGGDLVSPADVAAISVVLSGPMNNSNLVLNGSIPTQRLQGDPPYTVLLPENVVLERVGQSTASLETFVTARVPHWNLTGAATTVFVRTATSGGNTALSAAASPPQNFIDVADANGFARNDYVVLDDETSAVEYLRVQFVDGNRLWFAAPVGVAKPHAVGALVKEVTLQQKTVVTDYTLDAETGRITEVVEFGAGRDVVVSYTTDFVMPANYPLAFNDNASLDEAYGKWTGKPVVDGTYRATLWSSRTITVNAFGETNTYRGTSPGAYHEFRVGSAGAVVPYNLISSGDTCATCHQDVHFHGGSRRGYDTCIACHGTAGSEDRPRYVAANAPATDGVTINFRTMLHKIHMGADLANAATYTVVGFGGAAYPNNYTAHHYGEVEFPLMPGGVMNCTKCHGTDNTAWALPAARNHPEGQLQPTQVWLTTCGACHDSDAVQAHIESQTSSRGTEACAVCHGTNRDWNVPLVHKAR